MDMEGKHSLDEIYSLVKENNRMLRAMRRGALLGGIFKFVFWVILLFVIPYLLYVFYLAPILNSLQAAYENINTQAGVVSGAASDIEELRSQIPNFDEILKQFIGN